MTPEQQARSMKDFNSQPGNFYIEHKQELSDVQDKMAMLLDPMTEEQAVKYVHRAIDYIQEKADMKSVTQCEISKCSFCCHSEIFLGKPEIDYIKKHGKFEIDQARLARQRAVNGDYTKLNFADKACIMLKDGKCQVYEHRPALCRNHGVIKDTDPHDCFVQARDLNMPGTVQVRLQEPRIIPAEALASYITIKNANSIEDVKNISDWDWG